MTKNTINRADILVEVAALPPSALLTPRQAAAYLGTSTGVLGNWRSMRHGPRYHGYREFIRYRLCDLDQWMATRAAEITPEGKIPPNHLSAA